MIYCANGCVKPEKAKATESALSYGCDACEYLMNNELLTCSKFIRLDGTNKNTGVEYKGDGKCLDTWIPILQIETAFAVKNSNETMVSFRNGVLGTQQRAIS